jgi:acetamidase/formamidase
MGGNLTCTDAGNTAGAVASAATEALSDFKNSYFSASDAVIVASTAGQGQVAIIDDGTTVTINSCVAKGCASDDLMDNEIIIE